MPRTNMECGGGREERDGNKGVILRLLRRAVTPSTENRERLQAGVREVQIGLWLQPIRQLTIAKLIWSRGGAPVHSGPHLTQRC